MPLFHLYFILNRVVRVSRIHNHVYDGIVTSLLKLVTFSK